MISLALAGYNIMTFCLLTKYQNYMGKRLKFLEETDQLKSYPSAVRREAKSCQIVQKEEGTWKDWLKDMVRRSPES